MSAAALDGADVSGPVDVVHVMYGGLGGQVAVVRALAAGMRRHGLRTGVVAYAPPEALLGDTAAWPEVDVLRPVPKRTRLDRAGARAIGAALEELRPRAVLWHSAYAPRSVRRARRRGPTRAVVLVEHTPLSVRDRGEDLRSIVGLGVADAVVLLSDGYAAGYPHRRLTRLLGRVLRVVPNGVDTATFSPSPEASGSTIARDGHDDGAGRALHVGMAARFVASKDPGVLVAAVARLREQRPDLGVRLTIAGDGPLRDALTARVAALGLEDRVVLPGVLDEHELADLLRTLDVYVQASHGETLSTAVLQAWATGLPVVASDVDGLRDLVRDGDDGLLVPARDAGALAEVLADLADDLARARALGSAGRRRVAAGFSVEAMVAGHLAVLAAVDPDGPWAGGPPGSGA